MGMGMGMGKGGGDSVGGGATGSPATTGTYGERPTGYRLPGSTRVGPVQLQVSDLGISLDFYERVLGLRRLDGRSAGATLGAEDGAALVELSSRPGVRPAGGAPRLGLYHFAILLPDRAALGRFVRHLADTGVRAGAADHLVSEAFYLTDPDGLGIEVYADRPRAVWRRSGRELLMATEPADMQGIVTAAGNEAWTGMPKGATLGHVHLHVGDLDAASAFYSEGVGLDRMVWRYPGALFLAAGGYHHHLGVNTWAGADARAPAADEARLLGWTLELPDSESLRTLGESLTGAGHTVDAKGADLVVADPWGTHLRACVARPDRHGRDATVAAPAPRG